MKKLVAIVASTLLLLVSASLPAQAAVYKTDVKISVPKYAAAGIAVPIDITVCPLATRSSKTCDWGPSRVVTLFANKKKVATGKTVNGLSTINWTPAAAGKYSLTASIAKATGLAAATSLATPLTVSKKTVKTPIAMKYCDSNTCSSTPMVMSFEDEYAQMSALLGKGAALAKGRVAYGQYLNTKNAWYTFQTSKVALNSEFGQYSADFSLEFPTEDYCTGGDESYDWSFRVLVTGTTKYAPVASPLTEITFECGGTSGGDLEMSYTYSDKSIDSSFDSVPDVWVTTTDPDDVGYELYSYFCEEASDCTDDSNWIEMDMASGTGDDYLSLYVDWDNGVGRYAMKVVMFPEDGSDPIEGDVFNIEIY